MKIKAIIVSMLAAAAILASCAKEPEKVDLPPSETTDTAYLPVIISNNVPVPASRTSNEKPVEGYEGTIQDAYLITFDASKNVLSYNTAVPVVKLQGIAPSAEVSKPNAVKVPSNVKYLFVVANPGPKVMTLLDGISHGQSWTSINEAITITLAAGDTPENLVDELRTVNDKTAAAPVYSRFTMLNSGDIGEDGLIAINPKSMYYIGEGYYADDAAAEAAANNGSNMSPKQQVRIERLTAKVKVSDFAAKVVKPAADGAKFTFLGWTLDVLNSKFFPYSLKTPTKTGHSAGTNPFYKDNFYTVDPNFVDDVNTAGVDESNIGILYNKVDDITREPIVTWNADKGIDYCIENTMGANDQLFKNATRVIIKATYYPNATWTGDWFKYGDLSFEDLAAVQTEYAERVNNKTYPEFVSACDDFYTKVKAENPSIAATDFEGLADNDLAGIVNGGELIRDNTAAHNCLRWYQNGLNYYWYEIRHDNGDLGHLEYGKYGVVRNNYYALTLTEVKGAGKPWYPKVDPDDPDPDGPGGDDEIDSIEDGYLTFEIKVAPWIYWETNISI